jgi:hypothetical protein
MQTAIVGDGKMSRYEARDAFLEYQRLLHKNAGRLPEEDELLRVTYREISKGRRVLDLSETFRLSGLNERWQPKLAIARADIRMVRFERQWDAARWCFFDDATRFSKSMLGKIGKAIAVPRGVFPQLDGRTSVEFTDTRLNWSRVRAAVPAIPPALRPAAALERYHVLWEAAWESVPGDPILLRRIGGHLFAVVAQWDLTPVEQAVLRGRYEG